MESGRQGSSGRVYAAEVAPHRQMTRPRRSEAAAGQFQRATLRPCAFGSFPEKSGSSTCSPRMRRTCWVRRGCSRRCSARTTRPSSARAEIRDAEHRGDELSHEIGRRLESTFVTPFDREDIHALISALDDVVDFIEECADTFILYRIEAPTAVAVQQASDHRQAVRAAPGGAREPARVQGPREVLDRGPPARERGRPARAQGDRRPVLRRRPPDRADQVEGDLRLLETTIDKAEDVANIIERITIKHA